MGGGQVLMGGRILKKVQLIIIKILRISILINNMFDTFMYQTWEKLQAVQAALADILSEIMLF